MKLKSRCQAPVVWVVIYGLPRVLLCSSEQTSFGTRWSSRGDCSPQATLSASRLRFLFIGGRTAQAQAFVRAFSLSFFLSLSLSHSISSLVTAISLLSATASASSSSHASDSASHRKVGWRRQLYWPSDDRYSNKNFVINLNLWELSAACRVAPPFGHHGHALPRTFFTFTAYSVVDFCARHTSKSRGTTGNRKHLRQWAYDYIVPNYRDNSLVEVQHRFTRGVQIPINRPDMKELLLQ